MRIARTPAQPSALDVVKARAAAHQAAGNLVDGETPAEAVEQIAAFLLGDTPHIDPAGVDTAARAHAKSLRLAFPQTDPRDQAHLMGVTYAAVAAFLHTGTDDADLAARTVAFEQAQQSARPGAAIDDVIGVALFILRGSDAFGPDRLRPVAESLLDSDSIGWDCAHDMTRDTYMGRALALVRAYLGK